MRPLLSLLLAGLCCLELSLLSISGVDGAHLPALRRDIREPQQKLPVDPRLGLAIRDGSRDNFEVRQAAVSSTTLKITSIDTGSDPDPTDVYDSTTTTTPAPPNTTTSNSNTTTPKQPDGKKDDSPTTIMFIVLIVIVVLLFACLLYNMCCGNQDGGARRMDQESSRDSGGGGPPVVASLDQPGADALIAPSKQMSSPALTGNSATSQLRSAPTVRSIISTNTVSSSPATPTPVGTPSSLSPITSSTQTTVVHPIADSKLHPAESHTGRHHATGEPSSKASSTKSILKPGKSSVEARKSALKPTGSSTRPHHNNNHHKSTKSKKNKRSHKSTKSSKSKASKGPRSPGVKPQAASLAKNS